LALVAALSLPQPVAYAQEVLPVDNGTATYFTAPRYRESESHPLRIVGYILHPFGWLAREAIFRPISYLVSSTDDTKAIFGYREPFDYRRPECFSADDSAPDCRSVMPFNYDNQGVDGQVGMPALGESVGSQDASAMALSDRQMFFPDVNYDFNSHSLNDLGRGRSVQIAQMLKQSPGLRVVLEGHTDYRGSDSFNDRLGMDRAETLRQELVSLGVPPDRLSTMTFGKAQPALPEQENWARAVNRRVEVKVGHGGDIQAAAVPSGESAPAAGWQTAE